MPVRSCTKEYVINVHGFVRKVKKGAGIASWAWIASKKGVNFAAVEKTYSTANTKKTTTLIKINCT